MDAPLYIQRLDQTLVPLLTEVHPEGHRFMQGNDPKHTSKEANVFLESLGINWWKTPAESLDCNPIENLWHKLEEFCRREVKSMNTRGKKFSVKIKCKEGWA